MLQLYDRNGDVWRRQIAQFDQIKWDHREGKPLPTSDWLGLHVDGSQGPSGEGTLAKPGQ
jgi:hypothetical protein